LKKIYFLIVNYFSTDHIKKLITSIEATNSRCDQIVVNNSTDYLLIDRLGQQYADLKIIQAADNIGFGCGCNLGIQSVYNQNPDALVWLINPDTTLDRQAIDYIQQCFDREADLAILGTRIRDRNGLIWFHEGKFNRWLGSLTYQPGAEEADPMEVKVVRSRWVSGCSLIINLSQFNHCPQFDDHYFLYYEDNDFCERYYQQGYSIAVTQAALVTHLVSATTEGKQAFRYQHSTFSKLYFLSQHGTIVAVLLNLVYMPLLALLLLFSQPAVAIGRIQGWLKFINYQLRAGL
jgi:N-acetylglucosaminyl-diphospho-decaprenol L-rhamnosyltransferase